MTGRPGTGPCRTGRAERCFWRRWNRTGPGRSLHPAEAAVPALVVPDRLEEVLLPEVGPVELCQPDLAVGKLPEQEVGEAHLPAGADQQIRIGKAGRVE